jgi:hypothetical protein
MAWSCGGTKQESVFAQEKPMGMPAESVSFQEFIETIPPGRDVHVADIVFVIGPPGNRAKLQFPREIRPSFHCERCGGMRSHNKSWPSDSGVLETKALLLWAVWICGDCHAQEKIIVMKGLYDESASAKPGQPLNRFLGGMLRKIGEFPSFGGSNPPRVLTLLRPYHDLYVKGRRAENQGMGIGAFAYYRQVVESSKDRIIERIEQVARTQGASQDALSIFDQAKHERQFTKAIEIIKDAIPQALFIGNRNPLLLLHVALSEDMHAGTDESALEIAADIRTVLVGLAERISTVLDDEAEMKKAVNRIVARRSKKQSE